MLNYFSSPTSDSMEGLSIDLLAVCSTTSQQPKADADAKKHSSTQAAGRR